MIRRLEAEGTNPPGAGTLALCFKNINNNFGHEAGDKAPAGRGIARLTSVP